MFSPNRSISRRLHIQFSGVVTILLLFLGVLYSQVKPGDRVTWEIKDSEVNQRFIEAYLIQLEEDDLSDGVEIQESHRLIVTVQIADTGLGLHSLQARDVFMDYLVPLDMQEVEKLDQKLVQMLMDRKYAWDDVDIPTGEIDISTDVRNVFKERNHKQTRDVFWWSQNEFDISTNLRWIIRGKFSGIGFLLEPGAEDAGYPNGLSRTLNIGVANEITKIYITIPRAAQNSLTPVHPLEGAAGFGLKFDTHKLGGFLEYQDMEWARESLGKDVYAPNHTVYSHWSAAIHWSGTFEFGVKRKMEVRGGNTAKSMLIPPGTFRLKVGGMASNMIYGKYDSVDEYVFIEKSVLPIMSAMKFYTRGEYNMDPDENGFSRWKAMSQIVLGLEGVSSVQFRAAYSPYKFLRVEITVAYVSPIRFEFENIEENTADSHTWIPGILVTPTVTIVF